MGFQTGPETRDEAQKEPIPAPGLMHSQRCPRSVLILIPALLPSAPLHKDVEQMEIIEW